MRPTAAGGSAIRVDAASVRPARPVGGDKPDSLVECFRSADDAGDDGSVGVEGHRAFIPFRLQRGEERVEWVQPPGWQVGVGVSVAVTEVNMEQSLAYLSGEFGWVASSGEFVTGVKQHPDTFRVRRSLAERDHVVRLIPRR